MFTFKNCRHIMPTGRTCKSPAMRGQAYCYYHGPQKSPRRTSRPAECEFEFETIIDGSEIPVIGQQILNALASNRCSKGRAAVLFQGLQTIIAGFKIPPPEPFECDFDSLDEFQTQNQPDTQNPFASGPGLSIPTK